MNIYVLITNLSEPLNWVLFKMNLNIWIKSAEGVYELDNNIRVVTINAIFRIPHQYSLINILEFQISSISKSNDQVAWSELLFYIKNMSLRMDEGQNTRQMPPMTAVCDHAPHFALQYKAPWFYSFLPSNIDFSCKRTTMCARFFSLILCLFSHPFTT